MKIKFYLPVVILFVMFYMYAALVYNTFSIFKMDADFKKECFAVCLALSIVYMIMAVVINETKEDKD